ncbi:putative disease resistance protein At4g11170 [Lotus japonicus]|uniref:putative disease resistance protein At4g11170 n=1 Tax=Lotus japonicus TaxID=34305 RepID=UPI00258F66F2|nr:putative disease resistance protein At4g11170 [Lotus japonicus]XP_057455158.1 putative disease resistance protein At4g11170 [Lotus japonicus]XP_057455159.1 putative disease resistance protein At4g11170 [Lotus japonicus]
MSSSSSSSRVFPKKYDVFISFRNEDTVGDFISYLRAALRDKNIITYTDDRRQKRGDDVGSELKKAIKDSVMAVVVFSKRYATSTWCLQEMVQMMECRRDEGQVVIPVFYKAYQTDVRHQTGSYKEPFEEHYRAAMEDKKEQDKVDSWRDALTQAANISGWHYFNHEDKSRVLQNVVNDVLQKLQLRHPKNLEGLVGIEEQCRAIERFLGKVGKIGVWGMAETGKTTVAKALFARHFPQYDSVCFLQNVREESEKHGLPHVRKNLLSELLKEQVTTSNFLFGSIEWRLSSKKILIVLDDVHEYEQLKYLCEELGDLGEGSALIVTTREKQVLNGRVDKIYEAKKWTMSLCVAPKKYDVFISFRGEDTRDNFTSYLRTALRDKNIITYTDDRLKKGDNVGSELEKAIKDSMMAVVVFSERYATSKWCLQEVVQIMDCRRDEGQVVIPVFYKTNPTDVRHQTGSYQKPFEEYYRAARKDKKEQDKVDSWKDALTQAANISGWDSSNHKDDSQVLRNVVNDVLQKLQLRYPKNLEGLVGIDEQCKAIECFLGKHGRIGVWGMGGTGKTTIAKALFAKHFPQYDSVCFLQNVREETEKHGLPHVRKNLLSELLKEQVTTSYIFGSIEWRLKSKKVLIVLDDVHESEQLKFLCEELGDLGEGSAVIVTTREKQVLNGRVDEIYEAKTWGFEKSLEFFCLEAFKKREPEKGYEDLSQRAVTYAGGVALALEVLGAHFRSKGTKFWESELSHLESRKEPLKKVQQLLLVSYHALSGREQAILLDIASFLKDENRDSVISILDACGFNATSGMEILKDKALISTSKTNTIHMHDLLQDMALDIVRNDVRGSRLRDIEQVCDVLQYDDKGIRHVEGIALDLSQEVDLQLSDDIFNRMPKLRIFRLYVPAGKQRIANVIYNPRLLHNHRPGSAVRYFEWNGYPSKSLPPNFSAKLLVAIRMPQSDVEELWEGTQELKNLEIIDLSECKQLVKLPDLSKASKLQWVYLSGCESLCVVHPSLLSLDTLVTLILDRCEKLKSLLSEKHLNHLEDLNVNDCSSLEEFAVSSDSIERLDLSKIGVKKLYSSIGRLSKLVWLNIDGSRLESLPDELSHLPSLKELRISNCVLIDKEKLHVLCAGLGTLKLLHLKECYELFELPDNISALSSLRELRLDGSSVEKLPTSIKLLEKLEILSLDNCRTLKFIPELPLFIVELHAVNCTALVTVSTLKTLSVKMIGKEKHISFMNAMKLNECSLRVIEDILFTMKSAEMQNIYVNKFRLDVNSYNPNSVAVCLPGSNVPSGSGLGQGSFAYRSTGSSIIIEPHDRSLSRWLGTIYSVVLSPSLGLTLSGAKIQCRIYGKDKDEECKTTWYGKDIGEFDSDHVFVWHGSSVDDAQVFEFFVTIDGGVNIIDQIKLKECGIHLMCYSNSELQSFLGEAPELEPEIKSELSKKLQMSLNLQQDDNKKAVNELPSMVDPSASYSSSLEEAELWNSEEAAAASWREWQDDPYLSNWRD